MILFKGGTASAAFGVAMNPIEANHIIQNFLANPLQAQTTPTSGNSSFNQILSQERALAQAYFSQQNQGASSSYSQPLQMTRIQATLTQQANTTPPPEAVKLLQAENSSSESSLPIESFVKDFISKAEVKFDKASQQWKAVWQKPQMFHYGMILKPELAKQLKPGESFTFQSKGTPTTLFRTENALMLRQGSNTRELDASGLKQVLASHIEAHDLNLFLDSGGNLVLEAKGPKALEMASLSSG